MTRQFVTAEKILMVEIKPGWKAGTKIKFAGEGDDLPDGTSQDIEFVIEEKPHPVYKRDGDNLSTQIQLTLCEALTGFSKPIKTLDGKELTISNKQVTSPGQELRFPARGMPNQRNVAIKGDLVIKANVGFPASLSDEQKRAY